MYFPVQITTTSDFQSSTLSKVSELVDEAQSKGAAAEEIINKFARYYTPIVLAAALLMFIIPFIVYKTAVSVLPSLPRHGCTPELRGNFLYEDDFLFIY